MWGTSPEKNWRSKNIKIWDKFRTPSQLDGEYIRKETRYRRMENGAANVYQFDELRSTNGDK